MYLVGREIGAGGRGLCLRGKCEREYAGDYEMEVRFFAFGTFWIFFCVSHSPYVKYGSFAILERKSKLCSNAKNLFNYGGGDVDGECAVGDAYGGE